MVIIYFLLIMLFYLIIFIGPPIVGLIFSIIGMKKQKSAINITGLILNSLALLIIIILVTIYIKNYYLYFI